MEVLGKHSEAARIDTLQGPVAQGEFEALVSQAFSAPPGTSFFDDFPIWDECHGSHIHRVGAYLGGRLASAAGARIAALKSPQGNRRIGIIGAVATYPMYRGQGLATVCVTQALQWLRTQGAEFAVLWGGEHAMYRRVGFELSGQQLRVGLAACRVPKGPGSRDVQVKQGWRPEVQHLLQRRPEGLVIETADLSWVAAHRNVSWWRAERGGQVIAYAAIGRGLDLDGIVHEWGGESQALGRILSKIQEDIPEAQIIGNRRLFSRKFIEIPPSAKSEHLCMAASLSGDPSPDLWFWGLDGA